MTTSGKARLSRKNSKTFSAWSDFFEHWRECVRNKRKKLAQELDLDESIVQLFCAPAEGDSTTDTSSLLCEYLFVGGAEAAQNIEWLQANQISHVLNVAQEICEINEDIYVHLNIQRLWLKIEDHSEYNIKQHFDQALAFIALARNNGGKVLVHCAAGVSRSATIAIAALMCLESMALKEALVLGRRQRPAIYPNKGFFKALFDLEEQIFAFNSIPREALALHDESLC